MSHPSQLTTHNQPTIRQSVTYAAGEAQLQIKNHTSVLHVMILTKIFTSPHIHHHVIFPELLKVQFVDHKQTSCYHWCPDNIRQPDQETVGSRIG